MNTENIILLFTTTSIALIAGLFYAYSCSVNLGLSKLSDHAYLKAMQSINKEILNPVFYGSFFGSALLLPISTVVYYGQPLINTFWFLLAATIIYIVGVFGVTMAGNVPLNQALAKFDLENSSAKAISNQRAQFEGPWNKFHLIRTIAVVIALICTLIAIIWR